MKNSLVVSRGPPKRPCVDRAAQYVRMSTDAQKYSLDNQAAAIAAYAARRHLTIVQTYADPGRSGLRIAGREGLQELIRDVQLGRADFDCVLVYDITRWGRSRMSTKAPITSSSASAPGFACTIVPMTSRTTIALPPSS